MTTHTLIKKDLTVLEFDNFADLYNAFTVEYGFPTIGAKAIIGVSGDQLFYWDSFGQNGFVRSKQHGSSVRAKP